MIPLPIICIVVTTIRRSSMLASSILTAIGSVARDPPLLTMTLTLTEYKPEGRLPKTNLPLASALIWLAGPGFSTPRSSKRESARSITLAPATGVSA